jgi:TM2 domain-containing membrane protein YozV
MNTNPFSMIPGIEYEEMAFVEGMTQGWTDDQKRQFAAMYASRRKDSQTILICTLIGFVGVAGIQHFILENIGMGILYLLTGGLCAIGTIIDLINYKKLTLDYNKKQIQIVAGMTAR